MKKPTLVMAGFLLSALALEWVFRRVSDVLWLIDGRHHIDDERIN